MGAARHAVLAASIVATAMAAAPLARADAKTCIAESEQAQQARSDGRLRDARDLFRACASGGCPAAVQHDCEKAFDEVDRAVPTVVLIVRSGGRDLTDVHVLVDGLLVAQKIDGRPLALDPGAHHLRIETPAGVRLGEQDVVAHQAEKNRLLPIDVSPPPPAARGPLAATEGQTAAPHDARQHTVWPWVVMGTGLSAAGVGIVLAVVGQSDVSASRVGCTMDASGALLCPSPYTTDGRDRQSLDALGSMLVTGGLITAAAGGVAILVGLIWHFAESTGPTRTPSPRVAGGTLAWAF
jgi:hypothetical protein